MPRAERPLELDGGPLTAFAADLRALRVAAGGPTYRELARRAHYSSSALSDAAGGRRLPGLDITLAFVRACEGDEDAWRQRWQAVAAELAREAEPAPPRQVDVPTPYVGLAAFGTEDADRFAGREAVVDKLVARVSRQRFLALFGASGEGKSSVLRAGLLPAFPAGRRVVLTPGPDPVEELAVQLSRLTGRPAGRLNADLAEDARALHLLARELLPDKPADADLIVVVDQFEELFTLCHNPDARAAFIALLLTAAQAATSRVRVVLGLRSDFYPHCAQHPDLAEALEDAQVLLGVMTVEEFRRAVTRPATAVDCTVESALVTQLVADAAGRAGALPLVSHALLETWHRRRGNTLTLAGYQAAGGIRSALARTAEQVYTELPPARQDLARQVLLRLTAPGDGTDDTKRRVARVELDALGGDVEQVLNALAGARLITLTGDEVDITHEALFHAWPRLRGWLDEDRAGLRTQRNLIEAAATWHELDRDPATLFRTTRLATTVDWVNRARPTLTAGERDFLDHSIAAEARARRSVRLRRRLLAAAVVALLITATAVAIPVVRQRRLADRMDLSRNLATRTATHSAEAARNALAAYQAYPTVEARSNLLTTAVTRQEDHRSFPLGGAWTVAAAISPDGRSIALRAERSAVIVDTDSLKRVAEFPLPGIAGYTSVQFTADGQTLVAGGADMRSLRLPGGQGKRTLNTGAALADGQFAMTSDSRTLAMAANGRTTLWDTTTGSYIGELGTADPSTPSSVPGTRPLDFADDDRTLATVGTSGGVELWDVPTRSHLASLPVQDIAEVNDLDFAPGGHILATGEAEGNVVLWDVATGTKIGVAARHTGGAYSVAFSPDGKILASSGENGRLALWDVTNRAPLPDLPVNHVPRGDRRSFSGIANLEFARNGTLIAFSDNDLFVWTADQIPTAAGSNITDLRYDGEGKLHVFEETGVLTSWTTTPNLQRISLSRLADGPVGGRFSRDGNQLLLGAPGKPVIFRDTRGSASIELSIPGWSPPATAAVRIAAVANDGRHVLAVRSDQPVVVWDVNRPDAVTTVATEPYSDSFTGAAFLHGSTSRVAVADVSNTVKIMDLDTGSERTLDGHKGPVIAIAPSPDGRLLATAGIEPVVVLRDTSTWQEIGRLTGHTSAVWRAEVSPDGTLLATGAIDGTIIVWDLNTRSRWATLSGRPGPVTALAWSPDGKTLATAGADSTITLWHTDPDTAIDRLCQKLADSTEGQPSSCSR